MQTLARNVSPSTRTTLKAFTLALGLACAAWAGTHGKKQADLAPNVIGEITVAANGMQVRFAGIPGFTYTIQSSIDGTNWTAITSVVAPASGLMKYFDSNSLTEPLFYRTVAIAR